jgi:hypothetical protein
MSEPRGVKEAIGQLTLGGSSRRGEHPLETDGSNPSENSALRAMTAIESSVTPEQYPAEEREAQVAAAAGVPNASSAFSPFG